MRKINIYEYILQTKKKKKTTPSVLSTVFQSTQLLNGIFSNIFPILYFNIRRNIKNQNVKI